ncbi:MAG TPA: ERCC4 domain-containing protein [Actinomycetes bacterium]
MTAARTFVVARNPEPGSRLPYLIRLPLPDGPLVLKAREPWPRTARTYCHRTDNRWPRDAEVLEEVPVRVCERRGVAVDLVLDRAREHRSQLVFTRVQGREAIFWQTPRTAARSRPGVRVPRRRAAGRAAEELEILIDTRERYPYKFAGKQARTRRRALPVGDYAAKTLVDGSLNFLMSELAALPRAAVTVEDRLSGMLKLEHVQPGFVAELLAAVQVRYPSVPVLFCESRPLAEDWTFRFLGAALAQAHAERSAAR